MGLMLLGEANQEAPAQAALLLSWLLRATEWKRKNFFGPCDAKQIQVHVAGLSCQRSKFLRDTSPELIMV